MSCRTTNAGSAWTTIARLESGLTDVQTLSTFHALRREGRGVPGPTEAEWAEFVDTQRTQMESAGFSPARVRSLTRRLDLAAAERPTGATWYALRNVRSRTAAEALNVETTLRQIAEQGGETYESVAARYGTYLCEVDRGRSVTAPEGYAEARDSWRSQGLPADHGTYTALTRLRAEAFTRQTTDSDRPRRITPVAFPNSRAIDSAGYDTHEGRLEITFRRRDRDGNQTGTSRTYAYRNVPAEVWARMCGEEGPGTVYNREVRNHDEFRYESREDEDAAAHRRCTGCGQWWAPGHSCPIPAAGEPVSTTVPVGRERTRAEHLAVGAEINRFLDENPPTAPRGAIFDEDSGRCIECDGHYTHSADCPSLTSSPAVGLSDAALSEALGVDDMSVLDREIMAAMVAAGSSSAAEALGRRRGLVMVDQLGNVHTSEDSDDSDYAARVRYLEEVEGLSTSDAQATVQAEDLLAEHLADPVVQARNAAAREHVESAEEAEDRLLAYEDASRAADLADQAYAAAHGSDDQDDDAAFLQCPACGQFMDGAHACPSPAVTAEQESQAIRDLRERLTGSPDRDGNRVPSLQEMVESEDAVYEAALAETEAAALADAAEYAAATEAPIEPEVPARPEPVEMRTLGVMSRQRRINARRIAWGRQGHSDLARIPTATEIRAAAQAQPVIVPVNYTGYRRYFGDAPVGTDGLPNGSFRVTGSVVFDRPGRGQYSVEPRDLQCTCAEYQENYRCPHIDFTVERYSAHLVPPSRSANGPAVVDPAAAQRAAEEAMRQDWMRSEEHAAEARVRHAAALNPADSYTDNFAAFEADHDAALERKARGEEPVPYMSTNALNGEFTRASGRGFGVEMEFDFPNTMSQSERSEALRRIGEEMYAAGLTPTAYQQGYHASAARGYTDNHAQGWSFERDCTVSGEIVSPVMYDEPETWQNIEKVCEIIRRHGGIANAKTGSHVHVGAPRMTTATASELMRMSNQHEDIMYRLSQNPDRPSHRPMQWCGPNNDVPQGGYTQMYDVTRIRSHNYGMNFGGVQGGDSDHPEIRYWDGTLNPAAIQAQVKVSAAMVQAAERNGTMGHSRRNREPVGSHHNRLAAVRGRSRRALTSAELHEDTATFRSFADTLFTRREDKAQVAALFAITKWQRRR